MCCWCVKLKKCSILTIKRNLLSNLNHVKTESQISGAEAAEQTVHQSMPVDVGI